MKYKVHSPSMSWQSLWYHNIGQCSQVMFGDFSLVFFISSAWATKACLIAEIIFFTFKVVVNTYIYFHYRKVSALKYSGNFFLFYVWKPSQSFTPPWFAARRCVGIAPTKTTQCPTLRLRREGIASLRNPEIYWRLGQTLNSVRRQATA